MIKDVQKQNFNEEYTTLEPEREKHYIGLCATCKNGPTCMFLNGVSRQILHCEEYEISDEDTAAQQDKAQENPAHAVEPKNKARGLCATCENFETCSYNKPEGGVWHCEDYA